MRYGEQIFEIEVSLGDIDLSAPDLAGALKVLFEDRHRALYTYALDDQQPVVVNARVTTVGALSEPPQEPAVLPDGASSPVSDRSIFLGEWCVVPVYAFDELRAEEVLDGPAIVESDTTTVLLRENDHAEVTRERWLDILIE